MKDRHTLDEYINGVLNSDRIILAKSITLIESNLESDRKLATALLDAILPKTGNSVRVGVTGVPGVGKSTFIEAFGNMIIAKGHKVAVLTIDPTSSKNHGSILGDKTRMETLASNKDAFVRPSPSGLALGGVRHQTRETILLCEAAGFDVVLVETVGVGQSETIVSEMVDFFLLLMLAGAGDELQGIKKGIIEAAEGIIITKADGDNTTKAKKAMLEYQQALHLLPNPESGVPVWVSIVSSIENTGIEAVWQGILSFISSVKKNGNFDKKRQQQQISWFHQAVNFELQRRFFTAESKVRDVKTLERDIIQKNLSIPAAVAKLFGQ